MKIREGIIGGSKITDITFGMANIQYRKNGKLTGPYKTGQEVFITYEHVKRDGSTVLKSKRTFITHIYCPFCGQLYDKK